MLDVIQRELDIIYAPIRRELQMATELYRQQLTAHHGLTHDIGSYLAESTGKMFRPALVLLSRGIRGQAELDKAVSLATAVELIHVASLVHDDIIDGALLRRNRPTLRSEWGDRISVVAGDLLYAMGYQLLLRTDDTEAVAALSKTTLVMCEGELLEMDRWCDIDLTEAAYLEIIEKKTARLFSNCCEYGGRLGGATPDEVRSLAEYGLALGMAFQIMDDCLDVSGSLRYLGKQLGSDLREGRVTLPLIHYSRTVSERERRRIAKFLSDQDQNGNYDALRDAIMASDALRTAERAAVSHVEHARRSAERLNAGPARDSLVRLTEYVIRRRS